MTTSKTPTDAATFDEWAEAYHTADELRVLAPHVDLADAQVLEIGCGTGRLTRRLAPAAAAYVAFDINPSFVGYCAQDERMPPDVQFLVASGETIPCPPNAVDVLVDGWALTAQHPAETLAEYQRVTRQAGTMLILAESWGAPDRADSEYVQLLRTYAPSLLYELEDALYTPLYDTIDASRIEEIPFESAYTFPSLEAAYAQLKFHIVDYGGRELSAVQTEQLRTDLSSFVMEDGRVRLSEHATLFLISNPGA